ncbi:MAG: YicC family protein [Thermoguttaceae bacterium]|nr:YicC family protein [Thermoguttaceae bacterium]
MLISMTGFGSASTRENGFLISSEIKTVNNRFLKTTIKLPEGFASLETKIDALLHSQIARGSVNFSLKLDRDSSETDVKINVDVLKSYITALKEFDANNPDCRLETGTTVDFLRLPGVICDRSAEQEDLPEILWGAIERNVGAALEKLQQMRSAEGASTAAYLSDNIGLLRASIGEIKALAPAEVESYRERLTERVSKILAENGATLDPSDIIREIAIFTDKADISEEISRFYSHLDQFDATMASEATCGKKLDFLTQEMFRETNTIGSKANSPGVLQRVVEMKSTIERIREMVQNVE